LTSGERIELTTDQGVRTGWPRQIGHVIDVEAVGKRRQGGTHACMHHDVKGTRRDSRERACRDVLAQTDAAELRSLADRCRAVFAA
jgi:hypothetical protein